MRFIIARMNQADAYVRRKTHILSQVASLVLMLVFVISPLSSAYAQEAASEGNSTPMEEGGGTERLNESASAAFNLYNESEQENAESQNLSEEDIEAQDSESELSEEPEMQSMSSMGSGDPTGTGEQNIASNLFKLEPDSISGGLVYEIPLQLPKGRGQMTPDLRLQYNSQQGEEISPLGYGWSLNIPYIEHLNRKGADKLYSGDDFFYSTMDGEIASTSVSTMYGAKIETGDFRKYEYRNGNTWIVTDKNGRRYTFGASSDARVFSNATSTEIFRWMLEEIRDANGNYIKFEYFKDSNLSYPSRVVYTGHGVTDGIFEVKFIRESRSDIATSTRAGFAVRSKYRFSEIQVITDGTWSRKYTLGYGTGDSGSRSFLSSITESGLDAASTTVSLPAINFTYATSTLSWVDTNSWDLPVNLESSRLADLNADGRIDIVQKHVTGALPEKVYINNGSGWVDTSGWTIPVAFTIENAVQMADFNGDGYADIVKALQSDGQKYVYLNNATTTPGAAGWTLQASTTWAFPEYLSTGTTTDLGTRIADVNNDGLPDVLRFSDTNGIIRATYLNTGSGWATSTAWEVPVPFTISYAPTSTGAVLVDVNGDNMTDIVESYGIGPRTYLNTGSGWELDATWAIPEPLTNYGYDMGTRLADMNGDGLIDVVRADGRVSKNVVYLNNGNGWTLKTGWTLPQYIVTSGGESRTVRLLDINGDSSTDFVGMAWTYGSVGSYVSNAKQTDMLSNIVNPNGGATKITYTTTHSSNGNPGLSVPLRVVSTIRFNPVVGLVSTSTYSYEGGWYYFTGPFERGIAGFATTTMADGVGNITKTFFHQGTSTDSSLGEYADHLSKRGVPYRVEKQDSTGRVFAKTLTKWDRADLGYGRNFIKQIQSIDFELNGDSTHKDKAQTLSYDDTNGNATEIVDWGEVSGSDSGTFTDVGTDRASTTITYAASTTGYLVSPSRKTIYNQSAASTTASNFYYDNLALNSVTKGNLTKEERWISGSNYASSTKAYNSYGLVYEERDPRSNLTSYTYDTPNLYISTSTNALGHVTGYLYDYSAGKVKQILDANGHIFQTIFDGLDRITSEKQPDTANPASLVTKTEYAYTPSTTTPSLVRKTSYLNSATSTELYSYFDGFGRSIQTRKASETANVFSVVDRMYNRAGIVERESLPYFENGSSYIAGHQFTGIAATPWLLADLKAYWGFDESSGVAYDSTTNDIDLTNNNSIPYASAKINNGADLEYASSQYFTRSNSGYFDVTSGTLSCWIKPETIDHSPGNPSIFSNSTNITSGGLEMGLASHNGDVLFGYFGAGNNVVMGATALTPGRWYMATFTWDTSGKKLFLDAVSDGTNTTDETLTAGEATVSIGRFQKYDINYFDGLIDECGFWSRVLSDSEISELYNGGSGFGYSFAPGTSDREHLYTKFEYDALDRPTKVITNVGTTTNEYDDWHTITTDPRGKRKDFYKDARGNLSQVIEHVSSTHGTTTYAYDLNNNLTSITDAAANIRNFTYDGLNRRLTSEDLHASGDGTFGTFTYTYDAAGNLTQSVDPKAQTVNYTYDALNRPLTEDYTGGTGTEVTYGYDTCAKGIGKLCGATTTDVAINYAYDALGQIAREAKTIDSTTYTSLFDYDRLGNIASTTYPDGSQVLNTYNTAGLLEKVDRRAQGGAWTAIVSELNYGPHEKVEQQSNANGTITYKTYDEYSLYRLSNLRTVHLSGMSPTLSNGLLSYWAFDESSGVAEDSSVNARDLTNNNSTPYVLAKLNNGADLEKNSSQYFSRSNGGDYDTTAGTLSCWIKPETLDPSPGNPSIFSNATNVGTGGVEFGVAVHNGDVLFGYLGAGNQAVLGSTALSTNTWYMVTFTWDSSGKELFLNAVSDGTNTADETLTAGETNISIGRNQKYNMNYFDGITDECGMWNRVLTGTEIATLYNSGTGMSYSSIESTETPLQDISYDYDANGNISQISENATSTAGRTVVYTYDDLNRLTSASTTAASSTPFRQTFSYDILGNLTGWKTGSGATSTYTYAGTGYANPHAPTSVNGVTHSYDNNGNLTSAGSRNFNWNYRNTIASIATSTATTTYAYDHANQRVRQYVPAVGTTTYASRFFDRSILGGSATTSSYIYAGDQLVATVEGSGTATSTRYIHADHLGSTNVVTNASGTPVQVLDYYPYGSIRMETGSDVSSREFIGQMTDEATNLSYLNARYFDSVRGQFLSRDPAHIATGNQQQISEITGFSQQSYLKDPQSLNSYMYARSNPIIFKDPAGKWVEVSGSIYVPGRGFSAGIRFDGGGIDFFMSGGFGHGGGGGLELAWAPGVELPHQRQASINATAQYAHGLGVRATQNFVNYDAEEKRRIPNGDPSIALVLGFGGGASIQEELSAPILTWKGSSSKQMLVLGNSQIFAGSPYVQSNNLGGGNSKTNTQSSGNASNNQKLTNIYNTLSRINSILSSMINNR